MQINNISSNFTNSIKTIKNEQKRVDNNQIAFEGKTKVFMGAGSALAASALYSLSKKDGVNSNSVINEYYQDRNSESPNVGNLKRFNEQERYEILQNIDEVHLFPKAFRAISKTKTENDEYRFDANEVEVLFLEAAQNIEDSPSTFDKIINIKNNDDSPRFNAYECVSLMRNAKYIDNYPNAFDAILNTVDDNGNFCFDGHECAELIKKGGEVITITLPKATEILKSASESDINSIIKEIKKIEITAKDIIENKKESKDTFNVKAELQRNLYSRIKNSERKEYPLVLSSGEIIQGKKQKTILENVFMHNVDCRKLAELTNEDKSPRFTEKELCELFENLDSFAKYNASVIYDNLTISDKDGKPFFTNLQCKKILLNTGSKGFRVSDKIFSIKKPDESMRFTADEYVKMLTDNITASIIYNHKAEFIACASMFDKDGNPVNSMEECITKCQNIKDDPTAFECFIDLKNKEHQVSIKAKDIIDLELDVNSFYRDTLQQKIYIEALNVGEKHNLDIKEIKLMGNFIQNNRSELPTKQPRALNKFFEANLQDGKFDFENMQKYITKINKFDISQRKFDALMELKTKYGISTEEITKLILSI